MAGIGRQAPELVLDVSGSRAVHCQKRGLPARWNDVADLTHHIGPAAGVGSVVEDRVSQQHQMGHSLYPQSVSVVTTSVIAANPKKKFRARRSRANPRSQGRAGIIG